MGKRMKIRGVLRDALRQRSVGVIEEIPGKGLVKYGKPAGIIACIVPTTNPDLTPAGNAIYAIKARDVVIFSPHPRSKHTSFETVRLMREALEREGAPPDILQCLVKVNIPMSQALMARADLIIATAASRWCARLQLRNASLRRGRRQLDDGDRRDGQHRGSRAQHAPLEDFRLRLRLLADGNLLIESSIYEAMVRRCKPRARTSPRTPRRRRCAA
jgi:sulfoacetaldehyde dehydrogenase